MGGLKLSLGGYSKGLVWGMRTSSVNKVYLQIRVRGRGEHIGGVNESRATVDLRNQYSTLSVVCDAAEIKQGSPGMDRVSTSS